MSRHVEDEMFQGQVRRPTRDVMSDKNCQLFCLLGQAHCFISFQNASVRFRPERVPLFAEDLTDIRQRGHVVSRTAEDDGGKIEIVDRQNVGAESRQNRIRLPGQVDRGGAVDGQTC